MKQRILIYLRINTIFSETMQNTETNISQFILEDMEHSKMVSNCQKTILFTIEMLVYNLQLKIFPDKLCHQTLQKSFLGNKSHVR